MNTGRIVFCGLLLWAVSGNGETDQAFRQLSSDLSSAACVELTFINIMASDVFKTVDSTDGTAVLAHDGRYRIRIGGDEYLFDGHRLYSYSADNNQVTVETVDSTTEQSKSVAFLTRLDDWYTADVIRPSRTYRLIKRQEAPDGTLPDSMRVTIDAEKRRLRRVAYFDINDDRHEIVITGQHLRDSCAEEMFLPDWPDSVETVKLF
ncbi:MAG: outer membrane lipoprotein carrier protein LolA [Candidatus Zixiibacteriota bacterium]|nr:MAG: outer membrane lipoprotein carrier protein LolA [candidate division Zixibacteria bacterium]